MQSRTIAGQALLALLGLALVDVAIAEPPAYPSVGLSTGVNFASGKYGGDAEIEDIDVPLALSIDFERVAFTVKVPYLNVRTTADGITTTESGLGDVSAGLTVFDVLSNRDLGLALDVTGAVKFGTADPDKGLGTGEEDVSVYFDGYKFFEDAALLASVGYRWRGSPADTPLDDVMLATIGALFRTEGGTQFSLTYDFRESAIAGTDDIREAHGFVSFPLGENWVLECHAFTGLTDSSANWGAGIGVATQLRRFGFRTVEP
ncbi:MAG: hypothetical protein KJP17_01070 [Gammaproteobacteria bacterium]|nr:hypothetical protein [Gammaproteobacteria bacterium]